VPFLGLPGLDPTETGAQFVTRQTVRYVGRDASWLVPAGMTTDLASVPGWLRGVVDSWGAYTLAAILHDYLCCIASGEVMSYNREAGRVYGHEATLGTDDDGMRRRPRGAGSLPEWVSRRDADGLFRRVLREAGVPLPQRTLMWVAVRLATAYSGGCTWREAGATAAVLPLGLVVTVLAVPSWLARQVLGALGRLCRVVGLP